MLNKDEQGIYGLGEHIGNSLHLEKGVYSMWSRDVPDPIEYGTLPAANLYGTHPFYMGMDTSSNWFGVFTRLSSA
jgi:alpha-glucosidase (family GH31 glycosyl hydrolase)